MPVRVDFIPDFKQCRPAAIFYYSFKANQLQFNGTFLENIFYHNIIYFIKCILSISLCLQAVLKRAY